MLAAEEKSENFSDEELEEIMDMQAPRGKITVSELRETIRQNPLLMAGLVFTLGVLLGVSLSSRRRK
jgi:hypothetical protein